MAGTIAYMSTEEKNSLTCSRCNEENDPGMLFCIHCGQGLTASAEKVRTRTVVMGGKCPSCGKEDDLNMRFCIFCSAPIYPDMPGLGPRPIDKFSWEMDLVDNNKPKAPPTTAAVDFKKAVQKSPTKRPLNLLPIAMALGAAIGAMCVPYTRDVILRTWLSGVWPAKSLTVYTQHPYAQVMIYQGKTFNLARADLNGAVRFNNLESGDYNVKISGNGLRTAFENVKTDPVKPTVIGYADGRALKLQEASNKEPVSE